MVSSGMMEDMVKEMIASGAAEQLIQARGATRGRPFYNGLANYRSVLNAPANEIPVKMGIIN